MNLSEFVELTGRGYRTVRQRLSDLEPLRQSPGGGIYYDARAALSRIYEVPETDPLSAERARLAREQADAQELKNRQLEGELISRRRAEDLLQRLAISAKERLRAIPAMAPGKIPKLTKADVVKLRKMIDDALRELASSQLPENF